MKIGIVNDMPLAVEALRRALAMDPSHSVIWTAANGMEAVARCQSERPDLVLMDLVMPVMGGVEAVRRIMTASPCPILIVTADVERNMALVFQALGHGAVDVVMTPTLGGRHAADASDLLHKIDNISWLSGTAPALRAASKGARRRGAQWGSLVAIGASAGGPMTIEALLKGLPADFATGIVLVQHVDPVFAAEMADWLRLGTGLPVRLAAPGDRPAAGQVLLAGTKDHIRLNPAGELIYTAEPFADFYRPSIDVFFQSLVEHWQGEAIGVLLTGMGQDGAAGLKQMRDHGWLTIAQDRSTSAVYGMPKAAFEMGSAVEILPLPRIAPRIAEALA